MTVAAAPVFVSTPPSRRSTAVAAGLSLLLHLAAAMAWLGVPVPRFDAPEEPPSITVDIVPPERAPAAEGKPAAKAQSPAPDVLPIPQLEEAPNLLRAPAPTKPGKPLTRSERDIILGQVIRQWRPPKELRAFPDAAMDVDVVVLADGMLAPPFSALAPWSPASVIDGYDALPPDHLKRTAAEAFYRALRAAQPLRLTPDMKAKTPLKVRLVFRYRDVR
jgi:hypothetical protein